MTHELLTQWKQAGHSALATTWLPSELLYMIMEYWFCPPTGFLPQAIQKPRISTVPYCPDFASVWPPVDIATEIRDMDSLLYVKYNPLAMFRIPSASIIHLFQCDGNYILWQSDVQTLRVIMYFRGNQGVQVIEWCRQHVLYDFVF
jgi:hypothetical protein